MRFRLGSLRVPNEDRRASDLGHAEIEGSEPSPGTDFLRYFTKVLIDESVSRCPVGDEPVGPRE